ncbi:hypothetical protein SLS58_011092 [Diplodia intermedia]|uniref:PB1 domain-containing protein n=1 Tax=Diplodia intermedia TaxID=856260 RepID=A0ABR3T1M2_9PEZI
MLHRDAKELGGQGFEDMAELSFARLAEIVERLALQLPRTISFTWVDDKTEYQFEIEDDVDLHMALLNVCFWGNNVLTISPGPPLKPATPVELAGNNDKEKGEEAPLQGSRNQCQTHIKEARSLTIKAQT